MNTSDHHYSQANYSNAKDFKSGTENTLKDWKQKIDELKTKGKYMAADAKAEFDKVVISLEDNQTKFTDYLAELGDEAEDRWDNLKDDAQKKWTALTDSAEQFFSKYS